MRTERLDIGDHPHLGTLDEKREMLRQEFQCARLVPQPDLVDDHIWFALTGRTPGDHLHAGDTRRFFGAQRGNGA